jgi:hypothetical protein
MSQSLQPFCTSLLGLTVSSVTVTSTINSTEALVAILFTTETITSTSRGYFETVTSYTATVTEVVSKRPRALPSILRRKDEIPAGATSSQTSDTSTPIALASYEANLITSACSRAAVEPSPTTISEYTTVTSVVVTSDIRTATSTLLAIKDAVSVIYAKTTITLLATVDAYDVITSDGLQDYCTSYLGFAAETNTVDDVYSTAFVSSTLTNSATETITLTESATVEVTQYHTAITTYAIPGGPMKRRTAPNITGAEQAAAAASSAVVSLNSSPRLGRRDSGEASGLDAYPAEQISSG